MLTIHGNISENGKIVAEDVEMTIERRPQEDENGNWIGRFETDAFPAKAAMKLEMNSSDGWSGSGIISQVIVRPGTTTFVEVAGNGNYPFPVEQIALQ